MRKFIAFFEDHLYYAYYSKHPFKNDFHRSFYEFVKFLSYKKGIISTLFLANFFFYDSLYGYVLLNICFPTRS